MMDLSSHGGELPIPMPINSKYAGDHHGHGGHALIHDPTTPLHTSNGPPAAPPSATPTTPTQDNHHHLLLLNNSNTTNNNSNSCSITPYNSKKAIVVKYRECLKNHAASIGGNATDGCGEFMPSGEEGTMEALKCSACGCHRNFHRKEVEGDHHASFDYYNPFKGRKVVGQKGVLISAGGADGYGYGPGSNSLIPLPSPHHHMIMPLGALQQTSESDEMEGGGGGMLSSSRPPMMKKRFRTKFTPEQKEKMLSFAERVGWRLQKQEEGVVQQFCQAIGVRRRVLKVWMHNNKHNFAKKAEVSNQNTTATTTSLNNNNISSSNNNIISNNNSSSP